MLNFPLLLFALFSCHRTYDQISLMFCATQAAGSHFVPAVTSSATFYSTAVSLAQSRNVAANRAVHSPSVHSASIPAVVGNGQIFLLSVVQPA
jgi:hypothetical protein